MTPSEWLEHVAALRENWPHSQLPDESVERWGADLADLPSAHVGAAIEAFAREGRAHAPNGGQIRNKAVELALDVPDWTDALNAFHRLAAIPARKVVRWQNVGDAEHEVLEPTYTFPRQAALAAEHPLVVAFIEHAGWERIRPALEVEATATHEAQLREKWRAFVRRSYRDLLYRGIPSGGLRRLRRIEAGEPRPLGQAISSVRAELEAGEEAA